MFEVAELGSKVSKEEYQKQIPGLRMELLRLQNELRTADFPAIIIIGGNDRPGRNDLLNILYEWMDPRYLQAHAFAEPTDEESEKPLFWRYWRALPAQGRIAVFVRSWTSEIITERLLEHINDIELEHWVKYSRNFEKELIDAGALILKFWLHLSRKELKKRLKQAKKDSRKAWLVTEKERQTYKNYEHGLEVMEQVFRQTSTGEAPWHIIESTDPRYRNLTVGQTIREELVNKLKDRKVPARPVAKKAAAIGRRDRFTILDKVDLTKTFPPEEYDEKLESLKVRINKLAGKAHKKGISTVMVFEGWDAAGKGGLIRRLTGSMDATIYRVVPIAAPSQDEKAHHYLRRFWLQLPRAGRVTIFDRSWYGRVLVERIEGFATEAEWKRAYMEINDFEEQLSSHGVVLLKFWLHISKEEQLSRFKKREQTPYKQYKITEDDYRNRRRWNEYELAVNEMIERTSTEFANWHIVAGNDKHWARIDVLREFCRKLEEAL